MGMTIVNNMTESALGSTMIKAFASPDYFQEKISSNGQGLEIKLDECYAIVASLFNAIAVTLGSIKDESKRMWLKFSDNAGGFIAAFYVEFDKTDENWTMGCTFDETALEKVDAKTIVNHTDPGKFFGSVKSPFFHASYLRGVGADSTEFDGQIILTTMLSIKNYLETSATDDGFVFKVITEIPDDFVDGPLRAMHPDNYKDDPTASLVEDLGEFTCKVTKTGPQITFLPGEDITPFIKDDTAVSVMIDSMNALGLDATTEDTPAA